MKFGLPFLQLFLLSAGNDLRSASWLGDDIYTMKNCALQFLRLAYFLKYLLDYLLIQHQKFFTFLFLKKSFFFLLLLFIGIKLILGGTKLYYLIINVLLGLFCSYGALTRSGCLSVTLLTLAPRPH